jgi:hypothetical protein
MLRGKSLDQAVGSPWQSVACARDRQPHTLDLLLVAPAVLGRAAQQFGRTRCQHPESGQGELSDRCRDITPFMRTQLRGAPGEGLAGAFRRRR